MRNPAPLRFDIFGEWSPSGNGVGPMDIDNFLERRGKFIAIEFKRPGEQIPRGQEIALSKLVESRWTVVLAYGHPPDHIQSFALWGDEQVPGDARALRQLVADWWKWASQF